MAEHQVFIRGGGPCGMAAAITLQEQGIRATVIVRATSPAPDEIPRLETVARLELISAVFPNLPLDERSGIHPHAGGVILWSSHPEESPRGYIIDRAVFAAALLRLARAAGVTILPEMPASKGTSVIATGRHGAGARRRLTGWRQVALAAAIEPAGPMPDLWTESLAEGWLSMVGNGRTRVVTAFTEPAAIAAASGLGSTVQRMLGKSRMPALAAASLQSRVTCCECTPSSARNLWPGAILAGDSAVSRDPLCAQGLVSAISDGSAAGAGVMTLLEDPETMPIVEGYFHSRHQHSAERHVKQLSRTYGTAGRTGRWWQTRSHKQESEPHQPFTAAILDGRIRMTEPS